MSASAPPVRRRPRTGPLAALTVTLSAVTVLTLTACENGEGLRDEGPSATAPATTPPAPSQP
jgi:hypothetical protein